MTTDTAYPQAKADTDNRHFLEEWQEGRLVFQACESCGRKFFYARPLCPHCWSDALEWVAARGEGEIVSYSLIHRPNHPSFLGEVPIALAEIRLLEGVRLLARVVGAGPGSLRTGMPVRLLSKSEASRFPLPTFRPQKSRVGDDR
jgi:uncharacterized OB-fold protein